MGIWTPTNDEAIPADDTRLLLAKAWAEGYEAGSTDHFSTLTTANPYEAA